MKAKIELYKMRTFSEMLGDTFSFLRQNFKSLFKGLFFIAAPVLLLAMIAGFFFWKGYQSLMFGLSASYGAMPQASMLISIIPLMLCVLVASTLIMDVTFSYIKLYRQNKEQEITVSMLWQESKKHFWKLIGAQFTIVMIVVVIMILFVLLARMVIGNVPETIIFLFLIIGIIGFYFGVKLAFFSFFIVVGDTSVMDSFSGSYSFTKGIFWKTLGFLFIIVVIVSFASNIFYIPGYILLFINTLLGISNGIDRNSFIPLLSSALMAVGMACAYLLYSVTFVAESIFYFSEIEKEQGVVANREIDEIGNHEN